MNLITFLRYTMVFKTLKMGFFYKILDLRLQE